MAFFNREFTLNSNNFANYPIDAGQTSKQTSGVLMIDALRGFALASIVLLHQIEHFNFFAKTVYSPQWLQGPDGIVLQRLSMKHVEVNIFLFAIIHS